MTLEIKKKGTRIKSGIYKHIYIIYCSFHFRKQKTHRHEPYHADVLVFLKRVFLVLGMKMIWRDLIQRMIFISLTGLGVLGNTILFERHVYTFTMDPEHRNIDIILIHLAFVNTIIIYCIGVRKIATVFYIRNFLNDVGCKTVIYLERVARGLSICTTCLLSVVQAVTINPRISLWRRLKPQTVWHVLAFLLLFWIFNSLISFNLLHYITAGSNMNRSEVGMYNDYCYMLPSRHTVKWLFLSLMALRDVTFQGLMGWSSGSMALRLYKHYIHVLYLHSSSSAHNSRPEIRATKSVLTLMTCFLFFYWADFIFSFYTGSTVTHDSIVANTKACLVLSYAALSPFVLIIRNIHAAKPCCVP
ncbi:putative vomeronasal receptor-like protein 4 isoform X1 [Meriones unguiculatus]|uniref:putative vomeronasal receptor-like protein 4 isoform X1 n=2 Tax=Meriones unguiculatus TaxID=10047 RepID=UPI000B4F2531|nr:putative vomeronasal receptor-like protein 4 isoform X1 [Meriones unguiculatus]